MGHGGKRVGAGRPRGPGKGRLSFCQRQDIGLRCEELHDVEVEEHFKANRYSLFNPTIRTEGKDETVSYTDAVKEHLEHRSVESAEDVESALHSINGTTAGELIEGHNPTKLVKPNRLFFVPRLRPYGMRSKIITQVAKEKTNEFGMSIRKSTVDRCWKEYRRNLEEWRKS